jgi:hypothetical protein
MNILTVDDERRLRELALGLAKGIEDPNDLIKRLGFTNADYDELAESRTFKAILTEALSEWQGANNTHKRIKLKAAVNIEEALPSMYSAMVNDKEPLASRVKAFEAVARVGGLGNPEIAAQGPGQFFRLEINLDARVGGHIPAIVIEQGVEQAGAVYTQSHLLDDVEEDEL